MWMKLSNRFVVDLDKIAAFEPDNFYAASPGIKFIFSGGENQITYYYGNAFEEGVNLKKARDKDYNILCDNLEGDFIDIKKEY